MKERILISVSVPKEQKHVLEQFDRLVRLERLKGGRSELTIRAWKEYVDHHWPGNPQKPLIPPVIGDPHRDRAAISFLRHQLKLPLRQIAKIVGRSIGYVSQSLNPHKGWVGRFRGHKVRSQTLQTYKERFNAWMDGRYLGLKEAFTIS